MPIDRTVFNASVDDSGSGTDGTIEDKAWFDAAILDPIDAALAASVLPTTWTPVTFSAANFVAAPPMTWTVVAGNQVTNHYALFGKTLIWALDIFNSTLSGTPSNRVALVLPGGIQAARTMRGGSAWGYVGGAWEPLMLQLSAGTTTVDVFRAAVANFAVGSFYLSFTLTIEIL